MVKQVTQLEMVDSMVEECDMHQLVEQQVLQEQQMEVQVQLFQVIQTKFHRRIKWQL